MAEGDTFPTVWAADPAAIVEVPSAAEIALGFACGKAKPGIFNWLFQTLMSTINDLNINEMASKFRAINTTEGIQGGGNLETDRTLRLNIPGLEPKETVTNTDLLVLYDEASGTHKKQTRLQFISGLGGDGGIITNADNIGDGPGEFFAGISGDMLEFRTLKNAGGLTVATAGDVVTIALANYAADLTYA